MENVKQNDRQRALDWWEELEIDQKECVERYFGHDIGTIDDDVVYFYSKIFDKLNPIILIVW